MVIKELYSPKSLPTCYVAELEDGRFYYFHMTPYRMITAADLHPLKAFTPIGENGTVARDYTWRFYGLERAESRADKRIQ